MAGGAEEDDPFYFSDTIREIDEEAPYILLRLYQQEKYPVALLCVDTASGEEALYAGHVTATDYTMLEIGTSDGQPVILKITNADFYPLERKDAPPKLKAITTDAYGSGFHFDAGKLDCYMLVQGER
jgi:hypothetical protein